MNLIESGSPSADLVNDNSARPGSFLHGLHSADHGRYRDFRATLTPKWWRVRAEILIAWLLLVAAATSVVWLDASLSWRWAFLVIPAAAIAFGLLVHHLSCFLHEAAHFNLAPRRTTSDLIANVAAGALVLMDIRSYRVVHLAHHRNLGTVRDTERSYFQRPGARFVLKSVTGVAVIEVLRNRSSVTATEQDRHLLVPACGAALHAAIVVLSLVTGHVWLAIAWVLGVFSLYPLLNALRQNLEHRAEDAGPDVDYTQIDHGAVTRVFVGTFGAPLIGGVGFSRHLMHHWDPGVSYTNLPAIERFLRATDAVALLDARSTTHQRIWRTLRRAA